VKDVGIIHSGRNVRFLFYTLAGPAARAGLAQNKPSKCAAHAAALAIASSIHPIPVVSAWRARGSGVMAYESVLENAKSAESEAFRRLLNIPNLDDWDEAFGAWLRAMRSLQHASGSRAQ